MTPFTFVILRYEYFVIDTPAVQHMTRDISVCKYNVNCLWMAQCLLFIFKCHTKYDKYFFLLQVSKTYMYQVNRRYFITYLMCFQLKISASPCVHNVQVSILDFLLVFYNQGFQQRVGWGKTLGGGLWSTMVPEPLG